MIIKYYLLLLHQNLESFQNKQTLGIKISKIGKIYAHSQKSEIIDEKRGKLPLKIKDIFTDFKS